jgi:hypothetical protein
MPGNMALAADFVLRRRLHTLFQNDFNLFNRFVNRVPSSVIRRCAPAEAANPAVPCSNGPISVIQSSGRSEYKALLLKLDKRVNRYQFTASYTLQDLETYFTGEDLTNWFGHAGSVEPRHVFAFSGILDLPWGFQTSLIAVYSSKAPFNARVPSNIDLNGDGTTNDLLPGLGINSLGRSVGRSELFQLVNDFNARFAGRVDATGVNTVPFLVLPARFDFGDNFQSHDIRVSKNFRLTERLAFEAFGEVFNVFNIANLGGYSTTLDFTANPAQQPTRFNFGQPTLRAGQNFGTGGPRALQFGARFTF